jgi:hypothetical protein
MSDATGPCSVALRDAEPLRGFSVAELCRRWKVGADKVRGWIDRGELAALNTASNLCSRPRYVITPEALEAFERGERATGPKPRRSRGRKPRVPEMFYARR